MSVLEQAQAAEKASFRLASASTEAKNRALAGIAETIDKNRGRILAENLKDQEQARKTGLKDSLIKRLVLSEAKIDQIVESVRDVERLEDPVGKTLIARELDDGLVLRKKSVPIGVIGVIFESRPDALVQISTLCVNSGNAVILKGGSEALHSNRVLFDLIREGAEASDPVFRGALHLVETREQIGELLELDRWIDLVIPRGSNELVRRIQESTRIPVLGHAEGICHLYVDRHADLGMAVDVAFDAKCQYPAVCNAIETLLVHRDLAERYLPRLAERLKGVELRGDERTRAVIPAKAASEADWRTEYLDLILSIRVVDSLEEAVDHINTHSSHHTDAIVTGDEQTARRFLSEVDSSSVMWNCSTRFADGFRYGLGAEVGISTGKIHARGPVGLEGLTSTKFILEGSGQIVAQYAGGGRSFTHRDLPPQDPPGEGVQGRDR
ncbi:MAG: glutamate-5-semialdehyde dehydrogenase [Spirochaetales bacterium]|nr:glutamate-5-semialdehyde dehydrogenase [Spirochaetales bacterium]